MTAVYMVGDVRRVLATLEPGSVDLVLTSPPFLALRSYLPAEHPDKPAEIGSEATPGAYIDTLLDVVEACARVLAPHGTICLELGDTYSGSGGAGGDYNVGGLREGQERFDGSNRRLRAHNLAHGYSGYAHDCITKEPGFGYTTGGRGWPLDKSLCLIPEIFRFALVYGFNPLTGRHTPRWRARNVVRWCRPNPPVGALGDKFRPATSEMVVLCKARDRYFDLDAVRTPVKEHSPFTRDGQKGDRVRQSTLGAYDPAQSAGAPPLDWWHIPTQPYDGAHYATWPEQLCVVPIRAMCPRQVCRTCGQPSRRIVEAIRLCADGSVVTGDWNSDTYEPGVGYEGKVNHRTQPANFAGTEYTTVGWSDCGHNNWRPGLVLDPFAGSGTTLEVATGHGRHAIGIDLDARNVALARDRVGPLLFEEVLVA